MINKIKNNLSNGKISIGSWMQIPDASIAEIMGKAGYDWIVVDLEHGPFSISQLPNIFRAIELGGTLPFARVAENKAKDIKRALDSGAKGIIIPSITSDKELRDSINWAYYPPKGIRGVGYSRANLFGKNFDYYFEKQAKNIFIVAQIENIEAIDNLDKILQVDGLDSIIVGPYDLSGSMNITGLFEHPDFIRTYDLIKNKAKKYSIPMGLHIPMPDPFQLKKEIDEGVQFLAYGIDASFLINSAQKPTEKNLKKLKKR